MKKTTSVPAVGKQKKQYAQVTPANIAKTIRNRPIDGLTSMDAGKIVPLAYTSLFREDRVSRAMIDFEFDMMETDEKLRNAVHVTVRATLVPFLAFERFEGSIDMMNASYGKVPFKAGDSVVPFVTTHAFDGSIPVYDAMGIHWRGGEDFSLALIEAYNAMVNHRYALISDNLADPANGFVRDHDDGTLAVAPWKNSDMAHIVPKFDDASMEGEVALTVSNPDGRAHVQNLFSVASAGGTGRELDDGTSIGVETRPVVVRDDNGSMTDGIGGDNVPYVALSDVFGDLESAGISVSLANLEAAKKTAAWAKVRAKFSKKLTDDHIIDLLLQGYRVPSQLIDKPVLLDQQSTIFGYDQRYATDSSNLDESVTRGKTAVRLVFDVPPMMTGGIIIYTAEIVPDQLHERRKDYFLTMTDVDQWPNAMLDDIDPQKVDIVQNDHSDIDHDDAAGTFGYAGLNHGHTGRQIFIGGKYRRPAVDAASDENRQEIWANETPDPVLNADFYLATNIHKKVFTFEQDEPFEVQTKGLVQIVGNTQFGMHLEESTGDYDAIMAEVDLDRIPGDEVTSS